MKNNCKSRKIKDGLARLIIFIASGLTVLTLLVIVGFVFLRGLPGININFLTRMWNDKTTIVTVTRDDFTSDEIGINYAPSLGIYLEKEDEKIVVSDIDRKAAAKNALDLNNKAYRIKKDDIIETAGATSLKKVSVVEAIKAIESADSEIKLKVRRPGGGIMPMLISTIYIIILTLVIVMPIGVGAAIYLSEYAKSGRLLKLIRFAIQNLAGIPSIIYGLFGMLFFVQFCNMQYSILAGSLTLGIMLLPTIISTTEEAFKEVPQSYRHGSYGLGASKLQTIIKVILPSALPGILVGIILSIGRIVGESAALIWTAGTVAQIPTALVGSKGTAATLTTKMFWEINEASNIDTATSIALILILLIIVLNLVSKIITNKFLKKTGTSK